MDEFFTEIDKAIGRTPMTDEGLEHLEMKEISMEFNQKKEKTMKHELVHETVNIKGWDMVVLLIGRLEKKLNYHLMTIPDKTLHYINGYDTVGTKFMCIGEVVDGVVVDVFFDYLLGKILKKIFDFYKNSLYIH